MSVFSASDEAPFVFGAYATHVNSLVGPHAAGEAVATADGPASEDQAAPILADSHSCPVGGSEAA